MFTAEQHLDNLIRHINLVQEAGVLLGKRLIARGQKDFGRILIRNVYQHDVSKFSGIEWDYLHAGKDVPKDKLAMAVSQHNTTNDHHPECWGGFEHMPELAICEMACDWYARAMEFGTGLRDWIEEKAIEKYKIDVASTKYQKLMEFVDLLLEDSFATV